MLRACAFVLAFTAVAAAQPTEPEPQNAGTKLFDEGRDLAKAGNYAEACAKFEQSYALDNGVGTELNLADCKERLGHYYFAWTLFDEAARRSTDNPARAKFARERADALSGKLATVIVKVPAPDNLIVTIAGHAVKAAPEITLHVEAGSIAVHVETAQKAAVFDATKPVAAGATVEFDVPATPVVTVTHDEPAPDHRRRNRLILSYSIGGVGVVTLAVGVLVGYSAKTQFDTDTKTCVTSGGSKVCDLPSQMKAIADGQRADKGTIVSVIGIAAIAAGVTLYVTAPKDLVVSPMASNQTAGLAISGRF